MKINNFFKKGLTNKTFIYIINKANCKSIKFGGGL